jgi:hypothetical protein
MASDLRSVVLKAAETALKQAGSGGQTQAPPEPKKPTLSTGRAVLLGAGIATAGGALLSSRGREMVGSVRERFADEHDQGDEKSEEDYDEPEADEDDDEPEGEEDEDFDDEESDEPEGEEDEDLDDDDYDEPEAEEESDEDGELDEDEEEEPEERPRRRRSRSVSRSRG